MDWITLKNFRCFREEQNARLAPLTLLVGENSTGKTSFMAMARTLADVAYSRRVPDFKEEPYDLGSFDEIAHHRGGRGGRAETFEAGFTIVKKTSARRVTASTNAQPYDFAVTFKKKGTAPTPVRMRLSHGQTWVEVSLEARLWQIRFGTPRGAWESSRPFPNVLDADYGMILPPFYFFSVRTTFDDPESNPRPIPGQTNELPTAEDHELIDGLVESYRSSVFSYDRDRPYASAPVRSKPRRTYDPSRPTRDPEGDYVPMYLARICFQDQSKWNELQNALEGFGKAAGLFDEISIKQLGRRDSEPFQVQIRKSGTKAKGPPRNLIDVGYGVSQVLPVITELLRPDAPSMFLLQQPEVHLHPSAQAALGSLFCQVASPDRKLVVETHSDHLLDRVRMDVRDGKGLLKPEDVSILFFERGDLEVNIHSLRLDQEGNVLDTPLSYREFFLRETRRSLGL